jgi:hypothetical protein
MESAIAERLAGLDWLAIRESLWQRGYALTPALVTPSECADIANLYHSEDAFRNHIIMSRYRFGRGDYKYFDYPLPAIVQQLRERSYADLVPLAMSGIRLWVWPMFFPNIIPAFSTPVPPMDKLAQHLCCCTMKVAISTVSTRTCMVPSPSLCS